MFIARVQDDHPLAPPTLSPNTVRYPTPVYSERVQLFRAVNRKLYQGDNMIRPQNFSAARWRAAFKLALRYAMDYD